MLDFILERLYYELAWAYDLVSGFVSLGRWATWRRVALRYVRGERVLEVGCGTGHLLLSLAREDRRVWGCDLSPAMLRQSIRRVRRAGLSVPLCRARAQALPFATAALDTIVCTFPANYIGEECTWAEFARVLAPTGRAVVVYGVSVGRRTFGQRLVRWLLGLGRTSGRELRPAWQNTRLRVQHLVVKEGADRVGLLLADYADLDADSIQR